MGTKRFMGEESLINQTPKNCATLMGDDEAN